MNIKEQSQYFGIYCIECVPTKTKYVGQTVQNFYRRWTYHKWQLNKNIHENHYLQNAWNKYGSQSFKFYALEKFNVSEKDSISNKYINKLEEQWIAKLDTFDNGFNMTSGGESPRCSPMPLEARKRIGEKNRINMTGKKMSMETRKKMSESHKGLIRTEEHKRHLSEALKGRQITPEHREKCRLANQGSKQKTAKHTEEFVFNMRVDHMNGLTRSELANKYNVPMSYLNGIIYYTRWKHIVPEGWLEFLHNKKR